MIVSDLLEPIEAGCISVDVLRRFALVRRRHVDLTATEAVLLGYLAFYEGNTISIDDLAAKAWPGSVAGRRMIEAAIFRLRRKLGDAALITTVHGVGYRLHVDVPLGQLERRLKKSERAILEALKGRLCFSKPNGYTSSQICCATDLAHAAVTRGLRFFLDSGVVMKAAVWSKSPVASRAGHTYVYWLVNSEGMEQHAKAG